MESEGKYFFDSSAIIEIINNSSSYKWLADSPITTNLLCLGEVYYYFLKIHGKQTADFWAGHLKATFLPLTKETVLVASLLRFKNKDKHFSYPDCIGYVSALHNDLLFLTGDKEFEGMENVEFVK